MGQREDLDGPGTDDVGEGASAADAIDWLARAIATDAGVDAAALDPPDAVLGGAVLREAAVSSETVLTGAVSREALSREALSREAVLTDAELTDAELTDAELTDAELTDAELTNVLRDAVSHHDGERTPSAHESIASGIAGAYNPPVSELEMKRAAPSAREAARSDDLDRSLQARFGLERLKPWQREAIEALLSPHPVAGQGRALVIAPTGGGKSLTYQLPATILPGTSVVISPLVALMDDQVRALEARGIPATYLASNLDADERRRRIDRLASGALKLVYVAPERLANAGALEMLARLRPPLVAIDEAHCISQWGRDFRPDYLRLAEVLQRLAPAHALACTATATPRVRAEILDKLGWSEGETKVVLKGFARPNLHLASTEIAGARDRRTAALAALREAIGTPKKPSGAAILYAATRKSAEEGAELAKAAGYRSAAYHAGLSPDERAEVSEAFANKTLDVVAATNAFGMGIDRSDIRLVVHLQMPSSIEAYYQEVGRAGRDGAPASGLLLSSSSDLNTRRRLLEHGGRDGGAPDPREVERQWALFLELCRYVEAGSCRHDFILRYFGDEAELLGGCGHCDVCEQLDETDGPRDADEGAELAVRKALAGIARARRGAGMAAIAGSLAGESSARGVAQRLERLSTHGILSELGKERVLGLLRRMVTAGLVELTAGDYPMPYLTERGVAVMQGKEAARVLVPLAKVEKVARTRARSERESKRDLRAGLSPRETARFEALRGARMSLAKEIAMPAYVVCSDRTLAEIAKERPRNLRALGQVKGMGPARIEAYGVALLAAMDGMD